MKNNKIIFMTIIIIAVFLISGCVNQSNKTDKAEEKNTFNGEVKEFDVIAKQWSFDPSTITVNEGDTVRINIKSLDVPHGFAILEFGVDEFISPGKTTTFEFVASKKGTYKFFCSVQCGAGHGSMNGKLIVK